MVDKRGVPILLESCLVTYTFLYCEVCQGQHHLYFNFENVNPAFPRLGITKAATKLTDVNEPYH